MTRLHAQLLSLAAPRSREFLEDNNWCSLFPAEGISPVVCNAGLAPRPAGLGTASPVSGRRVLRCQKELLRGLKAILNAHLELLERCSEDYMQCDLKKAYGDLTDNGYQECIGDAFNHCVRLRDSRDAKIPSAIARMKKKCLKMPFTDLTEMLGFADVAASCSATTVGEVIDCIAAKQCIAWDVVSFPEARILVDTPPEFLTDYQSCHQ